MTNIFENAYFGKAYKTRDGRKAIYIGNDTYAKEHILCLEGNFLNYNYYENGKCKAYPNDSTDIISEWQEEINEEELDKLAEENNPYPSYDKSDMCVSHSYDGFNDGFKTGYRKAYRN